MSAPSEKTPSRLDELAQRLGVSSAELPAVAKELGIDLNNLEREWDFERAVKHLHEVLGKYGPVSIGPPLAPAEIPAAVARIAFTDTSALGLVSAPTPQALAQVLDTRERLAPADPHGRLLRASAAAGEFSPDPLWQAWFAAARGDFCTAVAAPPAPATTARPVTRPPSSTAPITTAPPDTPKSSHPRPPKKWKK